jgi:hypothetical protein
MVANGKGYCQLYEIFKGQSTSPFLLILFVIIAYHHVAAKDICQNIA